MQSLPSLWAVIKFLWAYGPMALDLVQRIIALVERMADRTEGEAHAMALAKIFATPQTKKERLTALEALQCRAAGCKLK